MLSPGNRGINLTINGSPQFKAINFSSIKGMRGESGIINEKNQLNRQAELEGEDILYSQIDLSPQQVRKILKNNKNNKTNNQNQQNQYNQGSQSIAFLNSNSIVKRYQLVLITCLIITSISSVKFSTSGNFSHIKNIRNFFNIQLLGNQNLWIYQNGDNIGESFTEIVVFEDMVNHFLSIPEVCYNFTNVEGFTYFQLDNQKNVWIQLVYQDNDNVTYQWTMQEFQEFLIDLQYRDLLLNLDEMSINIQFGSSQRVHDLQITIYYEIHSKQMLEIDMQVDYKPNFEYQVNNNDRTIRVLQRLLSFLIICSYLHNVYIIKTQNLKLQQRNNFISDVKSLQQNRINWCYSLIILNLITILNQTLAPFTSFLQLLPVFERHDYKNVYKYNFNMNLRYAVPLVLRIFIPVVILLNGFIFYSMLMYPGEYFEDYTMGFFSYAYQNFQVGTYQIFTELKEQGSFAYFLYGILYFYMVLVGNNLFPALFCTMIYKKLFEKDLQYYLRKQLNSAICPRCQHQNISKQTDQKQFQINITSPVYSPYLRGKVSTVQQRQKLNLIQKLNKVTQMFVQDEKLQRKDKNQYIASKIGNIKQFCQRLDKINLKMKLNLAFQEQMEEKIQNMVRQLS